MAQSWLRDYAKYVVDFQILRTCNNDQDDITHFAIIFKFTNGYGARVEFESDKFHSVEDDGEPVIDIHVEMLKPDGKEMSIKQRHAKKFCNCGRREFVGYSEVENLLEQVKEFDSKVRNNKDN